MSDRPSIHWQPLDESEGDIVWALGWIPDSGQLRWSLSSSVRLEGLRDSWMTAMSAAENAVLWNGYVGINDTGDTVEVTKDGATLNGELTENVVAATLANVDG